MTARVYVTDEIYVELPPDRTVVSWPGGHKVLDADATLTDLLGLLRLAVGDVMVEYVKPGKIRGLKLDARQTGYRQGYKDGAEHERLARGE